MINNQVIFDLFENQLKNKFKNTIFLSSIGARTCYNKEDICYLLENDPRVINNEERAKFLNKLGYKYYHTSVFAHTFAYFKVDNISYYTLKKYFGDLGIKLWDKFGFAYEVSNNSKYLLNEIVTSILSASLFKSVYISGKNVIGLSLRHFIEASKNCEKCKEVIVDLFENSEYKESEIIKKYYDDFKNHYRKVLPLYINKNEYDGWVVFAIQDISRITTHQLVRHTKLNYSQRSQRYVKEEGDIFIVPESIKNNKEVYTRYNDLKKESLDFYNFARDNNIPKEDARFGLLQSSKTSIIVSGTYKDIKDFVEKRIIKQAQWEIRNIAEEMNEILNEN